MNLDYNRGKFNVSSVMAKGKQLPVLAKILSALEFVPFKVEFEFSRDAFVYTGWSPKFRELNWGEFVPYYSILAENIDGELVVRIEEKDYNEPFENNLKLL